MEARYTNQESEALDDLALHLFPEHLGGQMAIDNVLVNGKPASTSIENGMLFVTLDSPLAPGEQTVLTLDFTTTVPGDESTKYHVLAFDDGVLALAHFYPMFAIYDDQGWHTEPSADHGDETFGDMSFFLVQVRSPADYEIAASGIDVAGEGDENFKGTLFAAGPMRDFYLAASTDYEVVQRQVGPVLINSYAPAAGMDGAQLALDVTAQALQIYNNRFGQYPYSELDIVGTPTEALGIEYPAVFANTLRIYDLADDPYGMPNSVMLESTTAHEAAHQWFYGTIGSDQLNEPWLDESLTQYATWLYYVDRYGEQNAGGFFNSFQGRVARATDPDLPIGLPADAYSGVDYGAIIYGRGPILLNELANLMGQETFDEFLLDYSTQFRWGIATAQDFQELAEEHCRCDLSEFFADYVYGE
jgi:aminopeptidase N